MRVIRNTIISVFLAASPLLWAQEATSLESDWLELVKGHKGGTMGVELMNIEPGDSEDSQKITLAVPKEAMSHPDTIEEVVVIGRKPEDPEPLDIRYEWLEDDGGDHYGLVIHLGAESNWPIRLYLNSAPGFTK